MSEWLKDNSVYFFWTNLMILILFLGLSITDLFTTIRLFRIRDFNWKTKVLNAITVILPFLPILTDWLLHGYLSRYIDRIWFVYFSLLFYVYLVVYLILVRRNIVFHRPFFNSFVKQRISLPTLSLYLSVIIVMYPIYSDLFLQQNPDIIFKLTSSTARNYFIDSTRTTLKAEIDLVIENKSNELYEVILETYYHSYVPVGLGFSYDSNSAEECELNQIGHCYVFPNNNESVNILKADLFFPNLFDMPINLNQSRIIIDTNKFPQCKVQTNASKTFGITSGLSRLGNYVRDPSMEGIQFEFPIYWYCRITIRVNDEAKFRFIIFGHIVHQPYILQSKNIAFATFGNYNEMTGIHTIYQYYGEPRILNKKIFVSKYQPLLENSITKCFEMTNWMTRITTHNDNILIGTQGAHDMVDCYSSIMLDNPITQDFYMNQLIKFNTDTNSRLIISDHIPMNWK